MFGGPGGQMGMGMGMGQPMGMGGQQMPMPMMNDPMAAMQQGMGAPAMMPAMMPVAGPLHAMAVNPALQMMYQQYALRWAAMQKMAAGAHAAGMASGMGMMPGDWQGQGQGDAGRSHGQAHHATGSYDNSSEDPGMFYKTRLCFKWRDGHCPYQDCKYAHGEAELRTVEQNMVAMQGQPPRIRPANTKPESRHAPKAVGVPKDMRSQLHKTRLCEEFMKTGGCMYGDRCTFAHGEAELRELPATVATAAGVKPNRGTLWKTRLCERFMSTGACAYGDRCTFAHGEAELKAPGTQAAAVLRKPGTTGTTAGTDINPGLHQEQQHYEMPGSSHVEQVEQLQETGGHDVVQGTGVEVAGEGREDVQLGYDHLVQEGVGGQADETGGEMADGYGKRGREEEGDVGEQEAAGDQVDAPASKRLHLEEEQEEEAGEGVEPACRLCAHLVRQGRSKVMASLAGLDSTEGKLVGELILSSAPRLEQVWDKCSPVQVTAMMDNAEGLSLMDRIDLLHAVAFHTHITDPAHRSLDGGMGLDSQKYVEQGMPPECADFVYLVMQGREGTASMSEYFSMLEVCRQLYGLTDDTSLSRIMIGL